MRNSPRPSPLQLVQGPLRAGDCVAGKFRIERVLGSGGMGVVYAAHHELLAQSVALKVLRSDMAMQPAVSGRFLNEVRACAKLRSEHVARVMDAGTLADGAPFMVMELLDGVTLKELLHRHGVLPYARAIDLVLEAMEALAEAHALGIVHRDLKPANLFLARVAGEREILKVLDFGISKIGDPFGDNSGVTTTGQTLGTPAYASPEQLRSARDVDARADIWSIGIILHELLSGVSPFRAESFGETFANVLERQPPPLSAYRRDVPPALERVVATCVEKNRDLRFPSVGALAAALAPFASPTGRASAERVRAAASRIPPPAPPLRAVVPAGKAAPAPAPRRSALLVASVVLVSAMAGVAIALALHRARPSMDSPSAAADASAPPPVVSTATASPPPTDVVATQPTSSTTAPMIVITSAAPHPANPTPIPRNHEPTGITNDRNW